jgi:Fic family protein
VGRGREELYADQLPELLRSLAERTRVDSIRASTALEGVDVEEGRARRLAADPDARIRNRNEHGRRVVIFEPPPWRDTEFLLRELVDRYNEACDQSAAHPLVLLGAFIVDFLAIHPVADGNGRLARLSRRTSSCGTAMASHGT